MSGALQYLHDGSTSSPNNAREVADLHSTNNELFAAEFSTFRSSVTDDLSRLSVTGNMFISDCLSLRTLKSGQIKKNSRSFII